MKFLFKKRLALPGVFMAFNLYYLLSWTNSKIQEVTEIAVQVDENLKDFHGQSEKKATPTDAKFSENRPTSSSSIRGGLTNTNSWPITLVDTEKSPSNSSSWEQWNDMTTSNQTASSGTAKLTDVVDSDDVTNNHKLPSISNKSTPRRFSDPRKFHELVSMGHHFLTTQSGCRMARWIYPTGNRLEVFRDCEKHFAGKLLNNMEQLEHNDTIYVTFTELEEFVYQKLDNITKDVVIISGQIQYSPVVPNHVIEKLLTNPHVMQWFCQNLPVYGGVDPFHPKISPFPYGLKEVSHNLKLNRPLEAYKQVFFQNLIQDPNVGRSKLIYAGPLHKSPNRASIPTEVSKKLQPTPFFQNMANSTYILSPNGDRPECFRHYEALGLGTVPITELDPILFRHLQGGHVIFNNTDWNLTTLESELNPQPTVNRNLIFEEYWMEYVDVTVGRSLLWWDSDSRRPQSLEKLLKERRNRRPKMDGD
jgi:hypothetical protein